MIPAGEALQESGSHGGSLSHTDGGGLALHIDYEEAYHVKLPVFEGPFELLYYLVKKEEINIWDISLARITEEYFDYLKKMQQLKINLVGDFLVMAATLLNLKSRMLLPKPPRDISPQEEDAFYFGSKEELVQHLLEYGHFKKISQRLKQREDEQKRIFLREPGEIRPKVVILHRQTTLYPHSYTVLSKLYSNLLQNRGGNIKKEEENLLPVREEITLIKIINTVAEAIKKLPFKSLSMDKLLLSLRGLGLGDRKIGKKEIVATFFALLELTRRGSVYLSQSKVFGRISIYITNWKGSRS